MVEAQNDIWGYIHSSEFGKKDSKSLTLLLQDKVIGTKELLRTQRTEIMEKIEAGEYVSDFGKKITRTEVDESLKKHFELEPGIVDEYLEAIIKLDEESQSEYSVMKISNLDLRKRIEDVLVLGENRRDVEVQILGKELADSTVNFLKFLVEKQIPFVVEMVSEIGVENFLHTYSGGLGVLSGDKHKTLADLGIPSITFALLPENGYGGQQIDFRNKVIVSPKDKWDPSTSPFLFEFNDEFEIPTNVEFGKTIAKAYCYGYIGRTGVIAPIVYMSTYHIKQGENQRNMTEELYPSGFLKLAAQYGLAHLMEQFTESRNMEKAIINLNEGHMAFVPVIMMRKYLEQKGVDLSGSVNIDSIVKEKKKEILEALYMVRSQTSFVTHTKDASAFDRYREYDAKYIMDPRDLNVIFILCNKYFPKYNGMVNKRDIADIAGDELEGILNKSIFENPEDDMLAVKPCITDRQLITRIGSVVDEEKLDKIMNVLDKSAVKFNGWGPLYSDNHSNYGIIMAPLAMFFAGCANSVAAIHKVVTDQQVFPDIADKARMHNVTNAIHSGTWWGNAKDIQEMMKEYIGDTKKKYMEGFKILLMKDIKNFRNLVSDFHLMEKVSTIDYINNLIEYQFGQKSMINSTNIVDTMTIVFARRAKGYKLNDLFVSEDVINGYEEMAKNMKDGQKVVIVAAGKAHPKDMEGQGYVKHIVDKQHEIFKRTAEKVIVVYKENYDMSDGRMFSKFDMCIANPVVGWEASGTSPMKNPLRLIMHTFDGFFAEFHRLALDVYGIEDASFGFGPKVVEERYDRPGLKDEYSRHFKDKIKQVVDLFFNNKETWISKQIEQLTIFTTAFQMERFGENYLTIWKKYNRNFVKYFKK